ncbi:arsenate reductase ArsC, partial [bacterium]|nr:arsenate reductase ArsC [bacterium]
MKRRILFLCTGNSCRSQMAEGFARHLYADRFEAHSAGLDAHELDPRAVSVMREVEIDISGQRVKRVEELADLAFDVVYTVCGHAHENCPLSPDEVRIEHRGFGDPSRLTR